MLFSRLLAVVLMAFALTACSTAYKDDKDEVVAEGSIPDVQVTELENKVGDRIFFEFDSSALSDEAKEVLKKQAQFMKENPELKFVIEGHCDQRGTREYNLGLGERRANAEKEFLVSLGIASERLTVISYGKERLAVMGNNEWAWSQNRRAVTVIK